MAGQAGTEWIKAMTAALRAREACKTFKSCD